MTPFLEEDCLRQVIKEARRHRPAEACGFLTGKGGRIRGIHPMKNIARQAAVMFEFDAGHHIRAIRDFERKGVEVIGIYHSHPNSPAYPSETDIERALLPGGFPAYPEYLYLIISLQDADHPVTRAFRFLAGGCVHEEELTMETGIPRKTASAS